MKWQRSCGKKFFFFFSLLIISTLQNSKDFLQSTGQRTRWNRGCYAKWNCSWEKQADGVSVLSDIQQIVFPSTTCSSLEKSDAIIGKNIAAIWKVKATHVRVVQFFGIMRFQSYFLDVTKHLPNANQNANLTGLEDTLWCLLCNQSWISLSICIGHVWLKHQLCRKQIVHGLFTSCCWCCMVSF